MNKNRVWNTFAVVLFIVVLSGFGKEEIMQQLRNLWEIVMEKRNIRIGTYCIYH
jgi:hypothetical protein